MPEIKLIKRMAGPGGNYNPGSVIEIDADIGQQLVDQKAAEWVAPVRQKPIERAVVEPVEKAVKEPVEKTETKELKEKPKPKARSKKKTK